MCAKTILQKDLQKFEKEFGHCIVNGANLLKSKKKYGHSSVTQTTKRGLNLKEWMKRQRRRKKINELSKDKIESLNKIGFSWTQDHESQWNEGFVSI